MVVLTAVLISMPPHRWAGSDRATHAMLAALGRAGMDVRALALSGADEPYTYGGVPVEALRADSLRGLDGILLTHPYAGPELRGPVEESRLPVVIVVHSDRPEVRRALAGRRRDALVVNSLATARGLGVSPGADGTYVVHPPLLVADVVSTEGDNEGVRAGDGRLLEGDTELRHGVRTGAVAGSAGATNLWSGVLDGFQGPLAGAANCSTPKGGWCLDYMIKAGLEGDEYRIVGVPGAYGDETLQFIPHVVERMLPQQLTPVEMNEHFFSRISVLLQLSITESWGMVACEALSRGIKVVSSRTPGTMEALGAFGSNWVRWIDPMSPTAPYDADAAVRGFLAAGPPTEDEDMHRVREVDRLSRLFDYDMQVLIRGLEARYGGGDGEAHR